jgi:hypothetical protein
MSNPAEQFRLDSRLLSPKREAISRDVNERAAAEEGRVRSEVEKSGNTASYLPRFFEFHERLANEWATKMFDACCETWKEQNRVVTPAFIRWVRDMEILPMIDTRKGTVMSKVILRGTRTRQPPKATSLRGWVRSMDRLASRWNSELETKAAALEYNIAKDQQARRHPLPEHKAEPLSAKPPTYQGTLARRRQNRPIDARKELISRLKARHPNALARRICELIDQGIDREPPVLRANLTPLESWLRQAPGKRSWVEVYDHAKTRNQVRSYVNKVPPLKTAKSPK